jgi:hypothetical protein
MSGLLKENPSYLMDEKHSSIIKPNFYSSLNLISIINPISH